VLNCTITDYQSLKQAYRAWALLNHPDKFENNPQAIAQATVTFQNVQMWMNQLKQSRGWA
jgi:DnaJ-class molecular chaperone